MSGSDIPSQAKQLAQKLIREPVQALHTYHVAPSDGLIKLDAMENPYCWPSEMTAQWSQLVGEVELNRYPDAAAGELKRVLRTSLQIPDSMKILLGNGSDEVIQLLIMCLGGEGRCVLAPAPSFAMYGMLATAMGAHFAAVPLQADSFALDMPTMLDAIDEHQPSLVFLAYPNNPTGNLFAVEDIEAILRAAPGLVVLDEAYEPFAKKTWLGRLQDYPNLLVMRTVSKLGLAGLRLGLLVGAPAWIDELNKLRLPYNINSLTQACACFALADYAVFEAQAELILEQRTRLQQALCAFDSLLVWPSEANFILCKVLQGDAQQLAAALREKGILIRDLHGSGPALDQCLRISVGNEAENSALLSALESLL